MNVEVIAAVITVKKPIPRVATSPRNPGFGQKHLGACLEGSAAVTSKMLSAPACRSRGSILASRFTTATRARNL
jgi:hypothetical protein